MPPERFAEAEREASPPGDVTARIGQELRIHADAFEDLDKTLGKRLGIILKYCMVLCLTGYREGCMFMVVR